jgi:hypothetical protein
MAKIQFRGTAKVDAAFVPTLAAYNLIRGSTVVTRNASKPSSDKWRIVEMGVWDKGSLECLRPPTSPLTAGVQSVDFTWSGHDEMDEASGDGWAELLADGSLTCSTMATSLLSRSVDGDFFNSLLERFQQSGYWFA